MKNRFERYCKTFMAWIGRIRLPLPIIPREPSCTRMTKKAARQTPVKLLLSAHDHHKKIVLDEKGDPSDVIIPYSLFVELPETYGWDLDEEEQRELAEALSDSRAGNRDAFVPASEV
jgi:PHD/YefM family antitoxin component YafN of YafNO toxin-antitoxin module